MTHEELQARLAASPRTAVYLTTPGCGPCAAVRPWAEELFADPAWDWVVVDTTSSPDIAGQLLVFSHPTLLLFAGEREVHRFSRVVPRGAVVRGKGDIECHSVGNDGAGAP